jgi:hypothetical protein
LTRIIPSLALISPPDADAAVAAAMVRSAFPSADAACAHAAAAATEEEHLLAAALKSLRVRPKCVARKPCVERVAAVDVQRTDIRWAWQCMRERDPERARTHL